MNKTLFGFLFFLVFFANAAIAAEVLVSKSAEGASVYFIQPVDGQFVSQEFNVVFGLSGMGVAPAGIDVKNTGHHHLLINLDKTPDMTKPLAANNNIKHFGKGQTQTKLKLPPGEHTLQLLLGNHLHTPHDKPVISEKITITVK